MAETTLSPAPAATPATGQVVRIVLFGRSRSGKSALLAALGEVVREGAGELKAELVTESDIEDLGKEPQQPGAPIVAYKARYRPAEPGAAAIDVVFLDCEGLAASELLGRVEELEEDQPELPLARAVLAADAMVLAVNASSPPEQLEADFAAFKTFLRTVEGRRGRDAAVGGLPVYLVLTHADLLARPLDTPAMWIDQLEARKSAVAAAFQASLAGESGADEPGEPDGPAEEEEPEGSPEDLDAALVAEAPAEEAEGEDVEPEEDEGRETGFGWVDLHVWATAAKRPVLRNLAGAKDRGPYGVAELFRQCLAGAADYRRREERSQRRLYRLVAVALFVAALLLGLTVAQVALDRGGRPGALAARVESFRFLDGATPEQYLRGSLLELRDRQRQLREIRDDPQFDNLPDEMQVFVAGRLEELTEYIEYYERLQAAPGPFDEWTAEGLQRLRHRLVSGELALPHRTWARTPAGLLWRDRLQAAEALLPGVFELTKWYEASSAEAGQLWTFSNHAPRPGAAVPWNDWAEKVQELLAPEKRGPPWAPTTPLPGGAEGLTYADVMRFFEVKDARVGWELERARLAGLLDVVAALGLAKEVPARPAVLAIPRDFRLADAADRLARLKEAYPGATRSFGARLPDAVEEPIAQAAREQYRALLAPARAEVARRYRASAAKDAEGKWADLRAGLRSTRELEAWNDLALVLLRLFEAQPEAPVPALVRFLGEKEFTLTFETVIVEARSFGVEPEEKAALTITHTSGGKETELKFEPQGAGREDRTRNVVEHTFRLKEKQSLTYRPGDGLTASLALKAPKGKARLVWVDHRSGRYQFERLRNPPLREANGVAGRVVNDVRLVFQPDSGVPRVPDLLPAE